MALEQRYPVVLLCCGSFNPVTVAHTQMFEIARNFLERTGNHIVISGILSPVHDSFSTSNLVSSKDRLAMCHIALKKHLWLSADSWETSQASWVKTIKILHHLSNKVKAEYGVIAPDDHRGNFTYATYPNSAVTLQPNGSIRHQVLRNKRQALYTPSIISCSINQDAPDDGMELNEASEPEAGGVVLNRLSDNFHKVCCAPPVAFNLQDNMIYGAAYDLRRTKVMLLCGGDFLESFALPNLWTDEEISEIVAEHGIVCIPRHFGTENNGDQMRAALDRLQNIFRRVRGTVIIVNDPKRDEIAHVSSTKLRTAVREGRLDDAEKYVESGVLNYISKHRLYSNPEEISS